MKAILLAGGQGTRLRPLTLNTPKPIVPIFDRPFLRYQLDLLRQVPEIDEVVLSLNYQPRRVEEVFGDGSDLGLHIRYVVEPSPLGTGGGIRFAAGDRLGEPIVVFNGDVLTSVDLPAVIRLHRERQAKATIVLTPVDNPSAYGLVETDADGNILAFLEKPSAEQIRCNTINAGIYVLEPDLLIERVPKDTPYSIERGYFPSLIDSRSKFVAYVDRGYWLDIGTPEKYRQAHRDIMDGRFPAPPFATAGAVVVAPDAKIDEGVTIEGPCFIGSGVTIKRGATVGPYSVIGAHSHLAEGAVVTGAILWPNTWVDAEARLTGTLAGRACTFGRNATIGAGMFGDKTNVTPYSQA